MKDSLRTGISFGLTSAVITTLGLMVGLQSGTHSKIVVLAGILTIAIADAFSDALGIHVSEEAENKHTTKQIWAATISTFLAKFLFAMTFVLPVILFSLSTAIVISLIWGLSILSLLSYIIAKTQNEPPWKIVAEHLLISIVVIGLTHWVGDWLGKLSA
jgi:VIT1/CCC1 family predicted Fe2+/Mn2+ transporter